MFQSHLAQAGAIAMASACLFGLVYGRWPERLTGVAFALAWVGSAALEDRRFVASPFHHLGVQPAIAVIDLVYAGFLLALLLTTRRRWVIIAFGLQALIVALHAVTFADIRVSHFDFFSAYFTASWGEVGAFAIGTALEGRRAVTARRP